MGGRYLPRLVDTEIEERLRVNGAVCIEGVKYCGKTRTSGTHSASILSLDDSSYNYKNLNMTRANVDYALVGKNPHLIDEWQLVPSTWDAVRCKVDEESSKGLFILCGSATPDESNIPLHSGFGRITTIRMRTMSLFESLDSDGSVSIAALFRKEPVFASIKTTSLPDLSNLIIRGGWPGTLRKSSSNATKTLSDYPRQICYMDLPRMDKSKSPTKMMMLLRSLARNESCLASASALSRDIREFEGGVIKDTTVQDYLSVLDRMFLIENQPAYNPNLRSSLRVGKSPKRHLTDPSLATAVLGLDSKSLMNDLHTFGLLFESLCERDLQIYATTISGKLYHFRDGKGRKIDAIVELPDGCWGAFEIKLTVDRVDEAAENLLKVSAIIATDPNGREPEFLCVLCGTASAPYRREDGVYVVPICSLGP